MKMFSSRPWLRAFSGLFINISAGWFGLAFITPNVTNIRTGEAILVLIGDVFYGILFLLVVVEIEQSLERL